MGRSLHGLVRVMIVVESRFQSDTVSSENDHQSANAKALR